MTIMAINFEKKKHNEKKNAEITKVSNAHTFTMRWFWKHEFIAEKQQQDEKKIISAVLLSFRYRRYDWTGVRAGMLLELIMDLV